MFSWRRYKIHRAACHVLISTGDVQATIIKPFKDFAKVVVCADRGLLWFQSGPRPLRARRKLFGRIRIQTLAITAAKHDSHAIMFVGIQTFSWRDRERIFARNRTDSQRASRVTDAAGTEHRSRRKRDNRSGVAFSPFSMFRRHSRNSHLSSRHSGTVSCGTIATRLLPTLRLHRGRRLPKHSGAEWTRPSPCTGRLPEV